MIMGFGDINLIYCVLFHCERVLNLVKCFFYMVQMTEACLFINVWHVALIIFMHHTFNHLAI